MGTNLVIVKIIIFENSNEKKCKKEERKEAQKEIGKNTVINVTTKIVHMHLSFLDLV